MKCSSCENELASGLAWHIARIDEVDVAYVNLCWHCIGDMMGSAERRRFEKLCSVLHKPTGERYTPRRLL